MVAQNGEQLNGPPQKCALKAILVKVEIITLYLKLDLWIADPKLPMNLTQN